jgi:hypothetical protein
MFHIDVIVPCYRYGHYLRECVESVLNQDAVATRVLIMNDASPDNTAEVAEALTAADARVTVRHHGANKGHIATFNEGLEWASGDAVLLLSADDLLLPGSLARAAAVFSAHANVGLAYGQAITLRDGNSAPTSTSANTGDFRFEVLTGAEFLRACCRSICNPVSTPTAIVRTTVQKRVGGYRPELRHSGDMEMWMRIAAHSDVAVINAYQACYRWHGCNMQLGYIKPVLGDLPERRRAFDALFAEQAPFIEECPQLQDTAYRCMAEEALWLAGLAFDEGELDRAKECLDFASAAYPPVRTWKSWKRFRLKRFIGPKLWSLVRPVVDRVRNAAGAYGR